MPQLARFKLDGGGSVLVDVDDEPGVTRVSRRGRFLDAKDTFETALSKGRDAAIVALTQFQTMARQPDEVQITFGLRMDAELGVVIAKAGMAGNFEVKLTWRSSDENNSEKGGGLSEAAELQGPDPVA